MKATFKVKLTPNPVIVRVFEGQEEIIYDRYIKVKTAERICKDLNDGFTVDWNDLSN